MSAIAADLHRTVETARDYLFRIDPQATTIRPAPGKWSKREILGHLIDSAANNHQRFVRARHCDALEFPGYDQDAWVAGQNYNDADWRDLIELWVLLNRHLVHVILQLSARDLETRCRIGDGAPTNLSALIVDYLAHMKHHLCQIEE